MFGDKLFWFDVETTGLDPVRNDIIQIACIVEVERQVKDTFYRNLSPWNISNVDMKALAINNLTIDQLRTFNAPATVFAELVNFLGKYIDPYNKKDKFIAAGYNVGFDVGFLREFFKKSGSTFFGSYFDYKSLDVYALVLADVILKRRDYPNHKLTTMTAAYGVEQKNAHDALCDIQATRDLFYKIGERL